jgi:hypothetical protein
MFCYHCDKQFACRAAKLAVSSVLFLFSRRYGTRSTRVQSGALKLRCRGNRPACLPACTGLGLGLGLAFVLRVHPRVLVSRRRKQNIRPKFWQRHTKLCSLVVDLTRRLLADAL